MREKLLAGFLKVRNEILRCGNLYRVLNNMSLYCDEVFVVDDASYDGTYEYLKSQLPEDHIIRVLPEQQSFADELKWKQELLRLVHRKGPWQYILWMDGDEVLDRKGTEGIRDFCKQQLENRTVQGFTFHYTQLWRNVSFARTDSGFDDGWFIKLWRYIPELSFEIVNGTHHPQFPVQIMDAFRAGRVQQSPFEVIHYGNYGVNLRWKAIQYWGGLGGVDRHIRLQDASYREVAPDTLPEGVDAISGSKPSPFTDEQIGRILELQNLNKLQDTFCIIIPTHNRGYALSRTLDSVLSQTYTKWICFVLDDGSSDDTESIVNEYVERDPRIFYAKYLERRGGVAMNEIGCDIAINTAQWWVRLGSDDWLLPRKLELDKQAFDKGAQAVYGPFSDHYEGQFKNVCNLPTPDVKIKEFLAMPNGFACSWANVAVKCSVLERVKKIWGKYCDLGLMNMEDAELNYKISRLVPWVFRGQGMVGDGKIDIINPTDEEIMKFLQDINSKKLQLIPDAVWNINTRDGSSSNGPVYAKDRLLTDQLIAKHEQERLWEKK